MSGAGARFELAHKIHVLTRKEALDGVRVRGKVVVDGGQYYGDVKDGKFLPRKISEAIRGGAML